MAKQHTRILIETEEVLVWRRIPKPVVSWCSECQRDSQKVDTAHAALLCQVDQNTIQEWIRMKQLHASQTASDGLLICLASLTQQH